MPANNASHSQTPVSSQRTRFAVASTQISLTIAELRMGTFYLIENDRNRFTARPPRNLSSQQPSRRLRPAELSNLSLRVGADASEGEAELARVDPAHDSSVDDERIGGAQREEAPLPGTKGSPIDRASPRLPFRAD
jgi:hypothetical protein